MRYASHHALIFTINFCKYSEAAVSILFEPIQTDCQRGFVLIQPRDGKARKQIYLSSILSNTS